jgi:hypothetical protein
MSWMNGVDVLCRFVFQAKNEKNGCCFSVLDTQLLVEKIEMFKVITVIVC